MEYKISVIIPAYNIDKFIGECIESLKIQTLTEFQVVLVNDGSTDRTLDIIEDLIENDNRFSVINKKNEGVNRAREDGLKASSGQYILFIDGDDFIASNTLELLYNNAIKYKSDIVCYDSIIYWDDKSIKKTTEDFIVKNQQEYLEACLTDKVIPSLWSKLYKRELFMNNNVSLPNIRYGEDLALNVLLALNCFSVSKVNECLYYYRQRENSVTYNNNGSVYDIIDAMDLIENYLKENDIYDTLKREFELLKYMHLTRILCDYNDTTGKQEKIYYYIKNQENNMLIANYIKSWDFETKVKMKMYKINYILGNYTKKLIYNTKLIVRKFKNSN